MEKKFIAENAIYQIYPASFKDSNNDGIGDLQGIISKLDYIQSLGIKAIWLSPIYESPMFDMGYDISDYKKINHRFGTMADFDQLMEEAKKRDIKVIMDLVINHTSDQCAWFQEALKDPKSKYRDYYFFRQGKGKNHEKYPNNWTSSFIGPAWTEVPNEKGTYYLHIYSAKQPDLNFHNEEVIKTVEDIMNFWMDKGVYGFRCDVISEIYKTSLEDGKGGDFMSPKGMEHYVAQPGNHEILKRLRKEVVDPHQGILIGECFGINIKQAPAFLDHELDTLFSFAHVTLNSVSNNPRVNPKKLKKTLEAWQSQVDWNGNYLENHDQHRSVGRFVNGVRNNLPGSKMLLTLIYTLRGTPFVYNGEEFQAHDYEHLSSSESHDCVVQAIYSLMRGMHLPKSICEKKAFHNGRDCARAPMAFNSSEGYGFTSPQVTPWQKFNDLGKIYNAEDSLKDSNSTIYFFKKINQFRRDNPVICYGDIKFLKAPKDVMVYTRTLDKETYLIVLNLTEKKRKLSKSITTLNKSVLLSNYETSQSFLRPYEAIIYKLN
ncbi:MAG: alpha-glucosidase [Bacilli bacterium]